MRKAVEIVGETRPRATRRDALRLGLLGLGTASLAVALRPFTAAAFTLEEADAPTTAAFHNACGTVSYHEKLAEEVRTILVARHLPAAAQPQSVVCPICGCKVAVK
jgi:hypothetical protein